SYLLQKGEEDPYTYGETPLSTLDVIVKHCHITATDTVFELGCGRGRTCFWMNQFVGCRVVGIDYIPEFIQRANRIRSRFDLVDVQFREEDILNSQLTGATVIYLYGTCYSTPFIQTLIKNFALLPRGTKIITVSYPLSDDRA